MPKVNRPQQARSQRTMNRILDAAADLLEEKAWQDLSIQEIVSAANSSVGSFYARFQDKDGLLQALDDRFFDRLIEQIDAVVADPAWQALSLAATVQGLARLIVAIHSEQKGVQRTLITAARLTPDPRYREREDRLWAHTPKLLALLLAHEAEIRREPAGPAAQFALLQMFFTAREMLLWEHVAVHMPLQGEALVTALAEACLNYLRGAP